jgi:hypothetical protein
MPLLERVTFYPIISTPLEDLLSDPRSQVFTCDPLCAQMGVLNIYPEQLEHGSFKTLQSAYLTVAPSASSGLGSKANHHVAAKRMFMNGHYDDANVFHLTRYPASEEYRVTMTEANLMYWSESLFILVISYIDHFNATHVPPPFKIPQLRFVRAGIAVVHSPKSEITRTYLLEEFIDEHKAKFVKYINNNDARPRAVVTADSSSQEAEVAEFLCFTQHFQYWKSGHRVYLSDLQGT